MPPSQWFLPGAERALLLEELRGLLAEEFDLGLIGIPEDELDALLHDADDDRAQIDDDAADTIPEAPAEPITKPGDILQLGPHRLICGDATDPAVVARLMDGAQATLMFTSPPYAQQRDYGAAKEKVGDWDALLQGCSLRRLLRPTRSCWSTSAWRIAMASGSRLGRTG